MIKRIEIGFAIPVSITDAEIEFLEKFLASIITRNTPKDHVHWISEMGAKPIFSPAQKQRALDNANKKGVKLEEPEFDTETLHFVTSIRKLEEKK